MGRPKRGALGSYPPELGRLIKKIRGEEPGFGPQSILTELRLRHGYPLAELPSVSSVAAFLCQEGMVDGYEKHSAIPAPPLCLPTRPHELWEMDGRGNEDVRGVGPTALLDIKDVFSGVYVSCFPARVKSMQGHPDTQSYQMAVRHGFLQFGMPGRIQCDHASVFHENRSKSPFPTKLHLWLIGLGVELVYSRVHRPTDQARVERSHQVLFNQTVRSTRPYKGWAGFYAKCQHRRHVLNNEMPSRPCNGRPPLVHRPEARHSGQWYSPHREADMLDMGRVWQYLALCVWYRNVASNKTVSLGGQVYYLPNTKPGGQLAIRLCPHCQYLLFHDANELLVAMLPLKGLDKAALIGKLNDFFNGPALQLPIPFDWDDEACISFLEGG